MRRFRTLQLTGDGKVRATGPFTVDDGFQLERLNFMLSQEGVVVRGEGTLAGGDNWHGETDAGGLAAGRVFAVAVAVMTGDAAKGSIETVTWCEQVELAPA